jgi:hypothetical protein
MHVDGYEDCVLNHCTPLYSADLELVNIQITSRRWLGNDLDDQDWLRRLHALVTTRIPEGACSKARPQIIEGCQHSGEVCFEVSFRGHEFQAGVS